MMSLGQFFLFCVLSCNIALGQTYKVLYSFGSSGSKDGIEPLSTLVADESGNLYGTTLVGGLGLGTIFELSPNADGTWSETVLYSLCDDEIYCFDGAFPSGLTRDPQGNLYGTTYADAAFGGGEAFELSPPTTQNGPWTYIPLYEFPPQNWPNALTLDTSGNLYGTAFAGGSGKGQAGYVFELDPSNFAFSVLYNFCSTGNGNFCPDGAYPISDLVFDKEGNLWGSTSTGGRQGSQGTGTVFKLSPSGEGWAETAVYPFPLVSGGSEYNVTYPEGPLSMDRVGNIYGTFTNEVIHNNYSGAFTLDPKGANAHATWFTADGGMSYSGVLIDASRPFSFVAATDSNGGSVLQLGRTGKQTVLHRFCQQPNCTDGNEPAGGLYEDKSGNLYGTTEAGGAYDQGVVYEITP